MEAPPEREEWMMEKPGWLSSVEDWINERWYEVSDSYDGLKERLHTLFGQAQLVAWLGLITAVGSAIATYYSYKASKQSADVSAKNQAFTEKASRDQIALSRPILSVMSGHLTSWTEGDATSQTTRHRLELLLRNSGARSALPAWLYVYSIRGAPTNDRSPMTAAWPAAKQIADIPSGTDVRVFFDLETPTHDPADLLLGLAYGDDAPWEGHEGASAPPLQKHCSAVKMVWLHASQGPANQASAPSEWTVTSATPLLVLNKRVASGRTDTEAAAQHLTDVLRNEARCVIPEIATPG
ncbi:hypothetical protein ACG02S_00965 [Roseateles sp. DC23W]|uniref:Uncharacterized protein n=1 Tax=Pelomonas dachongensis TaxID=3299029 RepID=A0ABW7EG69_9BURK